MGSRTINQGRGSTYPTKGSNAGINSSKMPKTERSGGDQTNTRTIDRAGQGGRGNLSPTYDPNAKIARPLGASNLSTIPEPK